MTTGTIDGWKDKGGNDGAFEGGEEILAAGTEVGFGVSAKLGIAVPANGVIDGKPDGERFGFFVGDAVVGKKLTGTLLGW